MITLTKHLRVIRNACRFRFAQSIGKRCSHLNAALVANEENAAKAKCLRLRFVWFCPVLCSDF